MPDKNPARALRRHHRERLKKSRKSYWGRGRRNGLEWTPGALGVCVDTPHPCSCVCCGNARKWLGEATLQERRAAQLSVWDELAAAATGLDDDAPDVARTPKARLP